MPVRIKIKTLFQGKVAINEKYFLEADKNEDSLIFEHNGSIMEISYEDIAMDIVGVSKDRFKDNFGKGSYRLLYYKWKPTIRQQVLL